MVVRRAQTRFSLSPLDNRLLANLVGPLDANLRQIEAAFDVSITHRGGDFAIAGATPRASKAAEAIQRFYAQAEKPLSVDDIQLGLVEITSQKTAPAAAALPDDGPSLHTRRPDADGPQDMFRRYEIPGAPHVDPWEQLSFASAADMARIKSEVLAARFVQQASDPRLGVPVPAQVRKIDDAAIANPIPPGTEPLQ